MDDIAAKRNAPHIARVKDFGDQILAVKALVTKKDTDWKKVIPAIDLIIKDIRASFSNREMALVATKLEEAGQWAGVESSIHVRVKLTEAGFWAESYINVLKSD